MGTHYTGVPNILKVLVQLFLDDLRLTLDEAGGNACKLTNLRKCIARIRVFDSACSSGNFLLVAEKQMRDIEAKINVRRDEADRHTEFRLTKFRGIELRDFSNCRLGTIYSTTEITCTIDAVRDSTVHSISDFLATVHEWRRYEAHFAESNC